MAMTRPSVGLADLPYRTPYGQGGAVQSQTDAFALQGQATRKVEIAALHPDGTAHIRQVRVPDHPIFTDAFSAFGRGTLIATPHGEVAIEDLQPGEAVLTETGRAARVQWIGACTFAPERDASSEASTTSDRPDVFRVMADSFGMGRPHSYVTLGQAARLCQTPVSLRAQVGAARLLTPVAQFADGDAVIRLSPPTPVRLFHLMLEWHATVRASGLECETFHPGLTTLRSLPRSLQRAFLDMFPLIDEAQDFGPLACPRAPDFGDAGDAGDGY